TRTALVTGGAKRVGRAIVERLVKGGFDVAFTYHQSRSEADDLTRWIGQLGRRSLSIRADLARADEVQRIGAEFETVFDRLDVLVNNASLYEPSDLRSYTIEQMRAVFAVHVESPLSLCRQFEQLLRRAHGHVINMVDLLAERPWPEYLI